MRSNNKIKYNIKPDVKLKNRLNGEFVQGDLINEEEIEGKSYFVLRNSRGSIVKLTKEAFSLAK
jgi:hypothetical protein